MEHSLKILEFDKIVSRLSEQAITEAGKAYCKKLLPLSEFSDVEKKQEETADFLSYLFIHPELPMHGLEEIRPFLEKAKTGSLLELREFNKIIHFLQTTTAVKNVVKEQKDDKEFAFYRQIEYLEILPNLLVRLQECIAGEDEIHDRASEALFSIRRKILSSQDNIRQQLNRILNSKSAYLQDNIVTMRSGRYVIPVKAEHRSEVQGIVHDSSGSGATVFIEPIAVVELNNKIRELEIAERDEIYRILKELTKRVDQAAPYLKYDAEVLEELDFIQAKAKLALVMNATKPLLNQSGKIILYKARHPLIPKNKVVPIYFELGTNFDTLVITGPNTGGKTVTLKTCGLFVLMAMAGLHIPAAENSEISWFRQILADIGDEQSIEQNLSTFSSHLKQIIRILAKAGPSTLVLTDELGAGTDPSEGAALAIAILDYLRRQGCHTVATTHYRELKGYALNTENVNNACCEFDEKNLKPTYRLLIGVPGVSNAFKISQRLGLKPEIIQAAEQLLTDENIRFEELVSAIEKSHHQVREMEDDISSLQRESKILKENLEKEKLEILASKEKLIKDAQEEAQEIIQKARDEVSKTLDTLRAEIKEAQSSSDKQAAQKTAREAERILAEKNKILSQEMAASEKSRYRSDVVDPQAIEVGEYYYSDRYHITGQAQNKPDARGEVTLKSGVMSVNVPADSLRYIEQKKDYQDTRKNKGHYQNTLREIISERKMTGNSEIKLLGMTVDEALFALDSKIDDAVLANMPTLRIVHGKGTGALRQAIHNTLKKDKRIKAFHLAEQGEGDSGVTIVEL